MGDRPNGGRVPGPDDDEINRIARVLIAEWERVERKPVNISYYATFADMARAMVADRRSEATLRADLAASQREVERLQADIAAVRERADKEVTAAESEVGHWRSRATGRELAIADNNRMRAELERLRKIVIEFVADLFLNHESETVSMYDHDTEEEHDALRYLASIGRVEIVSEQGRRVVARWTK